MTTIYQRCLANYQSKQWDIGAHALYNATLRAKLGIQAVPQCLWLEGYKGCVGDCLLYSTEQGSGVEPCLNYLLQQLNVKSEEYFEYSRAPTATQAHEIDACQVFSGPAQLDAGEEFRACLNGYSNTGDCKLPLIVWSGRSANKVPVGAHHATRITDANAKREAARRVYREVRDSVKALLQQLNSTWNANNLQVSGSLADQWLKVRPADVRRRG